MYSIEVWRDGVREAVIPIMKQEISIGRGSRSVSADLPIKGDPEVSRVHAVLSRDNEGRYWLVAKGRNATMMRGESCHAKRQLRLVLIRRSRSVISFCVFSLIIGQLSIHIYQFLIKKSNSS